MSKRLYSILIYKLHLTFLFWQLPHILYDLYITYIDHYKFSFIFFFKNDLFHLLETNNSLFKFFFLKKNNSLLNILTISLKVKLYVFYIPFNITFNEPRENNQHIAIKFLMDFDVSTGTIIHHNHVLG